MAEKKTIAEETGFGVATLPGTKTASGLRYVGDGEYIFGVPARDLSAEEAEVHAVQIAATHAATGRILYQAAGKEG